jgi:hypothetical protein
MNSGGTVIWVSNGQISLKHPAQVPEVIASKGSTPVIAGAVAAWESEGQIVVEHID